MQNNTRNLLLSLEQISLSNSKNSVEELFVSKLNEIYEPFVFQFQRSSNVDGKKSFRIGDADNPYGHIYIMNESDTHKFENVRQLDAAILMLNEIIAEKKLNTNNAELTEKSRSEFLQGKQLRAKLLKLNEKQFINMLDNLSSYAILLDGEMNLIYANKLFYDIKGYESYKDIDGKNILQLFEKEDRELLKDSLKLALEGKHNGDTAKLPLIDKTGEIRSVNWNFISIGKIQPGLQAIAMIGQDITILENSLKEIGRSEEKLRMFFNSVPAGVYVQDKNRKYLSVNDHACKIFNLTREQFINQSKGNEWIVFDENNEEYSAGKRPSSRSLNKGEEVYGEIVGVYKRNQGDLRWLLLNSVPVISDENSVQEIIVSFQDITELKNMQDVLLKNSAQLEKRVKEIECLYSINKTLRLLKGNLYEVLTQVVSILPDAWQHSELTCVKLDLFGQEFKTDNYRYCKWRQNAEILIDNECYGIIEIGFLNGDIDDEESPFLKEEKVLLDTIAITISEYMEARIANRKLEQSEKNYRVLVQTLPDGVLRISLDGIILYSNNTASDMMGYNIENELIGEDFFRFLANQNDKEVLKNIETIYKSDISKNLEFLIKRKNEEILPVELNATLRHDSEGEAVEYVVILRDISERLAAEEEIKKSRERLSLAIDATSDALWDINFNDNSIFLSPKFFSMLNYKPNSIELTINSLLQLIHPQDKSSVIEGVREYLESELPYFELEYRLRSREGSWKWILTRGRAIGKDKDNNPLRLIGTNQDITRRKEIEQELIAAREEALKSDKLKSEFLAQMSHEIRTPINTLLSASGLIEEIVAETIEEDLSALFKGMRKAGQRIIRTIDLILNMSEVQTGTYKIIRKEINIVSEILENIFIEFKQYTKDKGLEFNLIIKCDHELANVEGDEYTLNQIFANLVDNAVKYTNHGRIDIIISRSQENRIKVDIKDTGVGISDDYLKSIFDAFSQEDKGYTRRYEGSGLGLALVKKYCDINNAEISVNSFKDKGTTFTVHFN